MDLKICGIIDIILILLILLSLFIGFKKGFLKKAIGLIGLFIALAVAFVFCKQLAGAFESSNLVYKPIFENIKSNVLETEIFQNAGGSDATISDVLVSMGMPKFFANMFAGNISNGTTLEALANNIAHFFAHIITVIISFIILFIGVFIAAILLKILATILRGNAIIRTIDGILGMVLYFCLFMIVVYAVFAIMRLLGHFEFFAGFQKFLDVDMKLNENTFRISKFFYQHNVIYSFFDIFF
ncbi:MAG: CvpA family protein [Roseburia sp.]|nr:CvpA family protein [Anaeroplasma bactoclasticum]MCM1196382.1 CvpA family protein [Roseburia sp.]MCM1556149.1 CvpA family protein [Anaeroplasma bactoclasticum]